MTTELTTKRGPVVPATDVEVNRKLGLVTAVFSTFSQIDLDGEVVLPGALPPDGTLVVISSFGHKSWDGAIPVGWGRIRSTATEGIVDAQFVMSSPTAAETFEIVAELGLRGLGQWSYSLQQTEKKQGKWEGRDAMIISKVGQLTEVSPVLVGASIGTRTLSAKQVEVDADYVDPVMMAEVQAIADKYVTDQEDARREFYGEYLRYVTNLHGIR